MMRDRGSSCSHSCRTWPRPDRLTEPASESDTKRRRVRRHNGSSKACFSRWVHFGYVHLFMFCSFPADTAYISLFSLAPRVKSLALVLLSQPYRWWHGDATLLDDSVFVSGASCPRLCACCPELSSVYLSYCICAYWLSVNIIVRRATKPFFILSFASHINKNTW